MGKEANWHRPTPLSGKIQRRWHPLAPPPSPERCIRPNFKEHEKESPKFVRCTQSKMMSFDLMDMDEVHNPPIFVPPSDSRTTVVVIEELDSNNANPYNQNHGNPHAQHPSRHNFLPPLGPPEDCWCLVDIGGGHGHSGGPSAGLLHRGDSPPSPFSTASTAVFSDASGGGGGGGWPPGDQHDPSANQQQPLLFRHYAAFEQPQQPEGVVATSANASAGVGLQQQQNGGSAGARQGLQLQQQQQHAYYQVGKMHKNCF